MVVLYLNGHPDASEPTTLSLRQLDRAGGLAHLSRKDGLGCIDTAL